MAINPAKYPNRPGIYQEEINASARPTPIIQTTNQLVIGFSKTGPRMQAVTINNPREREEIFGPIDRNMEKKGSFFHRTIDNLVGNAPVVALNLFLYDDNLDELSYKSVSTSCKVENKETDKAGVSRFFNKNGFWERDTEALINVANQNVSQPEHILHFVNHSDRKITVFAYKSDIRNFDVTARDWYAEQGESVPTFMYPEEYISDYFIKVVVVAGDWTDYIKLQADPVYGSFFNSTGLIKSEIQNFINTKSVELLGIYDACLIPFFRDKQGRSYFIETLINADTDATGLYCAFDTTLIESTDFPIGSVDLIGNCLLDPATTSIDFLSYKENLQEVNVYSDEYLNKLGNVWYKLDNTMIADYTPPRSVPNDLSEFRAYNYKVNLYKTGNILMTGPSYKDDIIKIQVAKSNISTEAYYVIGGVRTYIEDMTVTELPITPATVNTGRIDVVVMDAAGAISIIAGNEYSLPITSTALMPTVPDNVIIIGYIKHNMLNDGESEYFGVTIAPGGTIEDNNITVDFSPTPAASFSAGPGNDYSGSNPVDTVILTFNNTNSNTDLANTFANVDNYYDNLRTVRNYQHLKNTMLAAESPIFIANDYTTEDKYIKTPIATRIFTDGTATSDAVVELKFASNIKVRRDTATIYFEDDELIIGNDKIVTMMTGSTLGVNENYNSPDIGVVSSKSKLYQDYFNGFINNGDYFYDARFVSNGGTEYVEIFDNVYVSPTLTVDKIVLYTPTVGSYNFTAGQKILLSGTEFNDKEFTILSVVVNIGNIELWVNEDVTAEVSNSAIVFDATKIHLRFSMVGTSLTVEYFSDLTYTTPITNLNSKTLDVGLYIRSLRANFKQTMDINEVLAINKIVVDATRYSEVQIGDFLEAFIDTDSLEIGQEPRRIARIIEKTQYSLDTTKVVLTTDIQININTTTVGMNVVYQTTFIKSLDTYVNTYNGMMLEGFRVRPESMPDGTEERQNEFLNLIAKDTSLYNALIDKNKVDFRYLVDSFGLGLATNSKKQYLDLLFARFDAFGFINMPSAASFKKSNNPSFTNADGSLNFNYILQGADLSKNPSFRYTFGTGNGRSYGMYCFNYVRINDNGRPAMIPPASYITNAYMRKYTSTQGGIGVGTIIAGVDTGIINGIVNVEIDLTPNDLEALSTMGANPIVYTAGRGFNINSEYTAEQTPKSSVSWAHNRETLIALEKEIYFMLLRYQWKFNNPEVRAEIELAANEICQRYRRNGFLSDYANVMNESNNTNEIIDNAIGVLSTFVELPNGLERFVHQTTILRTGDIQNGRFAVV